MIRTLRGLARRNVSVATAAVVAAIGSSLLGPLGALVGLPAGIAARELEHWSRRDLRRTALREAAYAASSALATLVQQDIRGRPGARADFESIGTLADAAAEGRLPKLHWLTLDWNVETVIEQARRDLAAAAGPLMPYLPDDASRLLVRALTGLDRIADVIRSLRLEDANSPLYTTLGDELQELVRTGEKLETLARKETA